MFGSIFAIIIIMGLLISWLKEWVILVFLFIGLLYLIRLIADLFWKGKDNEWW